MTGPLLSRWFVDRYPWAIVFLVFLVQCMVGAWMIQSRMLDHREDSIADLEASVQVLETVLHTQLQSHQYTNLEPLLTDWLQLYTDRVALLDLSATTGYSFVHHEAAEAPGDQYVLRKPIPYSYRGQAVLTIHWNLDSARAAARETALILGMILLITTGALAFVLRLAVQRRRDALELEERARALDLALRDLNREMDRRVTSEENLAREKERLQATLRNLGDGVVTTDASGCIRVINAAAEEMIGCGPDQCLGRRLDQIMDVVDERSGAEVPLIRNGRHLPEVFEHRSLVLRPAAGDSRPVVLNGTAMRNVQDEFIGSVLVIHDATGTRRLEQEQRRSSMLQALGVLAGGIAHDFNNLLMAISGNINLAQELSPENPELEETLDNADRAVDRATDLTRQLLTFSKGGSPLREAASIGEVIRESAEFVLHGSDLELDYDIDPDLPPVLIDKGQIGQVIQNLVINARQAMPSGGRLEIRCRQQEGGPGGEDQPHLRIQLSDSGCGITPIDLQHIFDPYYSTKADGSGLGLAVVHSIIQRHDGMIEVASEPGVGTTVTILLPAGEGVEIPAAVPTPPLSAEGHRILVMDDDDAVRSITCRMIRKLGFEVLEARNGDQALRAYGAARDAAEPIDAVVLDLTVPQGMGGKEALEKLLATDPDCRAVVASGYSNDPVMAQYRLHGFRAALLKPFTVRRLTEALAVALDPDEK